MGLRWRWKGQREELKRRRDGTDLNNLMNTCKQSGLFIVPVGELESFYKPAANKHATAWVDIVMGLNLSNDPELAEARKFVEEIVGY